MNKSGIHPQGRRILILPDDVEQSRKSRIIEIPDWVEQQHEMAQVLGVLVAVGADAWTDYVEKDAEERIIKIWSRIGPHPQPGVRVAFAKYGGLMLEGKDGKLYRLMNDDDLTAIVEDEVMLTELKSRQPFARTA